MNKDGFDFEIVKAEESHLTEIFRIEKESFTAPWSDASIASAQKSELINCISLLIDGAVLGYAMFAFVLEEGELLNIAVDPAVRGKGLGGALLSKVTETAKEQGVKNMFLEVRKSNVSARALYEKHGFKKIGQRKKYYRTPTEDAVVMALEIT